jgi:hypothetical protein
LTTSDAERLSSLFHTLLLPTIRRSHERLVSFNHHVYALHCHRDTSFASPAALRIPSSSAIPPESISVSDHVLYHRSAPQPAGLPLYRPLIDRYSTFYPFSTNSRRRFNAYKHHNYAAAASETR